MTGPAELRERLVAGLRAGGVLHDPRVAAAMSQVPRHVFLPSIDPAQAYADDAVPTKLDAEGQPISSASQPAIMALMLEQLDVRPGHRVLEIGAGTGYNAALLACLAGGAGHVTTVDIDADIVAGAREHLAACGFGQVAVVQGDGGLGWPPDAPYDRIILTVGAWDITPAWFGQLRPGGRLVLPLALRGATQYSIGFERAGDHLDSVSVLPCGFMRLRGAFAGPDRVVRLGDRTAIVAEPAPPPAGAGGAGGLRDLLAQPGEFVSTGVRVTFGELWTGLDLWLSMYEPAGIGWLTTPPTGGGAAAGGPRGMVLLTSAHGCALLAPAGEPAGPPRTGLRGAFEIGAQPFGKEGLELAGRLTRHVRDWDAAGRPTVSSLRVSAYPRGADLPAGQRAAVIAKQHTRLLLTWREPARSRVQPFAAPGVVTDDGAPE